MATCNVRGVAPSTVDIIGELVRQWPSHAVSAQSRVRFQRSARRRWAQHFRLRWRVRWRRLSARSELSAVPEAQKAFFLMCVPKKKSKSGSQKWEPNMTPQMGLRVVFSVHRVIISGYQL